MDDSSTKAGDESLPVTLRLGYVDPSGGNGSEHIEDFVDRVEDLGEWRAPNSTSVVCRRSGRN